APFAYIVCRKLIGFWCCASTAPYEPYGARPPDTTKAEGSAALIAGYASRSICVYRTGSGPGYQNPERFGSFPTSQGCTPRAAKCATAVRANVAKAFKSVGATCDVVTPAGRAHGGV